MSPRNVVIDCTFCGDKSVSRGKEDVVPLWLARKLAYIAQMHHPESMPTYVNYGFDNLADFQAGNASSAIPSGAIPAAYKLPDVCKECNNGWMSRLEEAAKHLIVGLLMDEQKFLAPYDQFILSTWMVKTCLTYDASLIPRYIPEAIGTRRFYEFGYPLPAFEVQIGHDPKHISQGEFVHSRMLVAVPQPDGAEIKAVLVAFQFDHLILNTCINLIDEVPEDVVLGVANLLDSPRFERIWPIRRRLLWPSDAARLFA